MILPPWWTDDAAARLLHPSKYVVPVVGAGISMSAQLPGAVALAEWLVDRVPLSKDPPDRRHLFGVVDCIDHDQLPPPDLQRMVADHINSFELRPSDLTDALVHVPSRLIITLNYDGLLRHTADELRVPYERLSCRELGRAHELIVGRREWPPEQLVILHLHGHSDDAHSIVLGGDSYPMLYRDPVFVDILFELAHRQTLAFMGTKLDESLFVVALALQINAREHLLLCTAAERPELESTRLPLSPRRNYVRIVDYSGHEDLVAFSAALAEPEAAVPGQPSAAAEAPPSDLYVPAELSDRPQPVDEDALTRSLFGTLTSAPLPARVSERDVANGHRTLIVGAPGTGKSELLRHVAAATSAQRPALIIRLADVRLAAGDARATLRAWSQQATSAQADVSLSDQAFQTQRYHFLLDGLDEVQTDLQAQAAQLVRDVATAFPQHAFTLTARPIDVLGVFGADAERDGSSEGWRVLDLVPSRNWCQRYLSQRGVELDDLEAAMPTLRDLRDLLSVPFFASRTADLFQAGRLEGLVDLWDLVRELVDASLEREGPQLMLAPEQVRHWIRSVALAALLAGRRSLSTEDLQRFELPDTVVGSTGGLVSALVQRLLLSERAGKFSFAHRIVGESLAAEGLEYLAPSEGLLAALVPRPSETLSGVRSDCLVSIGLLCSRSAEWRKAVGARDPLAAARATPASAEPTERQAAARLLWGTYIERQVWMWDYDVPGLAEDSEALGRLLRGDGVHEMLDEVRQAVHDGSAEDQGNAIRVLSRVNLEGFIDDLRRVLSDGMRDGVVRRQAAIAARDLGARELLDLIIERAVNREDEAEAQDCAFVALRMATDDELLDVGRRLLHGRYGHLAAMDAITRRLAPQARIAFARDLGTIADDELNIAIDKRLLLDAVQEICAESSQEDERFAPDAKSPRGGTSMADAETVFNAAYAAVRIDADSAELRAVLLTDPSAALRGIKQALGDGAALWQVASLTTMFSVEQLEAADMNRELVEIKEASLRRDENTAPALAEDHRLSRRARHQHRQARDREQLAANAKGSVGTGPGALAALLARPREHGDPWILRYAFRLVSQISTLSDEEREELRRRLADWWPDKLFIQTIRHHEKGKFSVEKAAGMWLWLGPALDMPLTIEQWSQVATCGVLTTNQRGWLRGRASSQSIRAAIELLDAPELDRWYELLAACPLPPPAELVDKMVACARVPATAAVHAELAAALVADGYTEHARALGAQVAGFADALRPLLAAAGELGEQQALLDEILKKLRAGEPISRESVQWMHGISDDRLLGQLFEILRLALPLAERLRDDDDTGWYHHDVLNPAANAIITIGGAEAVARYDRLLAEDIQFRWLRRQRDTIAEAVLRLDGYEAAPAAARAAGLPVLVALHGQESP